MNAKKLKAKFEKIGARVKFTEFTQRSLFFKSTPRDDERLSIDIQRDRRGEYFELRTNKPDINLEVLDLQAQDQHLLLMWRIPNDRPGLPDGKLKFLCGHDERHWFVAGIPTSAPVGSVATAKESLKPTLVKQLERTTKHNRIKRHGRKTDLWVRQGEWFFLPQPAFNPDPKCVLRGEPIQRGRGKPHLCEYLYRDGGETVYVCHQFSAGLREPEYHAVLAANGAAANWKWRVMRRNPAAYVLGWVKHPDHATIHLDVWHRVEMNTEGQSGAMSAIAFLD